MTQQRPDYVLFDKNTRAIVLGYQTAAVQRMLDFDYVCQRSNPSVAAIVDATQEGYHKCFWGVSEVLIPIYRTLKEATSKHPEADVAVNFSSFRSAYPTSKEALESDTIRTVAIIAEGVPEHRTKELIHIAKQRGKWIIGPAVLQPIHRKVAFQGPHRGTLVSRCESAHHPKPVPSGLRLRKQRFMPASCFGRGRCR